MFSTIAGVLQGQLERALGSSQIRGDLDLGSLAIAIASGQLGLALASALLPDELTFADLEATLRDVYRRGISAEIGSTEAELLRSAS